MARKSDATHLKKCKWKPTRLAVGLILCGFIGVLTCVDPASAIKIEALNNSESTHAGEFYHCLVTVDMREDSDHEWQHLGTDQKENLLLQLQGLVDNGKVDEVIASVIGSSHAREKRQAEPGNETDPNNNDPIFTGPLSIHVAVGEVTEVIVTVTDPDGDPTQISLLYDVEGATIFPNGYFTFMPTTNEFVEYLASLVRIAFVVTDGRGGEGIWWPNWQLCGCKNGARCVYENVNISTGRLSVVECECTPAWTGGLCTEDKNGCAGNPCYPGVQCFDVKAPGVGFQCDSCPPGMFGDGIFCEHRPSVSQVRCIHSGLIDNGMVYGGNVSVGKEVSFECNPGFQMVGSPVITCQPDYTFDLPSPNCQDIDECETDPCDANATCTNSPGSYTCACNDYFIGSGWSCAPFVEFTGFQCAEAASGSIEMQWNVTKVWSNTPVVSQYILTWVYADELDSNLRNELSSYYRSFETYTDKLDSLLGEVPSLEYVAVGRDVNTYNVTGLRAATRYRTAVRLIHSHGGIYNAVQWCEMTTSDGVCSPPLDVMVTKATSNALEILWSRPESPRGQIRSYVVQYSETAESCDSHGQPSNCGTSYYVLVSYNVYTATIIGLRASSEYRVQVAAVNGIGAGEFSASIFGTTTETGSEVTVATSEQPNGACFHGSFILEVPWTSDPLQQQIMADDAQRMLYSVFLKNFLAEANIGIKDTTLQEFDDVNMLSVQVYVDTPNVTFGEHQLIDWIHRLHQAVEDESFTDDFLATLRPNSISFEECDECQSNRSCPAYSECLNIPGGYTCHCASGFYKTSSAGGAMQCLPMFGHDAEAPTAAPMVVENVPPQCRLVSADIFILIESSSSIQKENFDQIKQSLIHLVKGMEVGPQKTQVGLARYSRTVDIIFDLNTYNTTDQVIQAIHDVAYTGTGTWTGHALQYVADHAFTEQTGRRMDKELHVIIITDGRSADNVTNGAAAIRAVSWIAS